jgi:hypothetical protein
VTGTGDQSATTGGKLEARRLLRWRIAGRPGAASGPAQPHRRNWMVHPRVHLFRTQVNPNRQGDRRSTDQHGPTVKKVGIPVAASSCIPRGLRNTSAGHIWTHIVFLRRYTPKYPPGQDRQAEIDLFTTRYPSNLGEYVAVDQHFGKAHGDSADQERCARECDQAVVRTLLPRENGAGDGPAHKRPGRR